MDWCVYILRCADGSLYTGITNDLPRRLAAHRAGTGARYTRARLPVRVVYREIRRNRSEASKREASIKRLSRADKLALVAKRRRRGHSRRARIRTASPPW